jgi:hypothetical protein
VNSRVQRLDTSAEHLRSLCDVRDIGDLESGIPNGLGRPARRDELDTGFREALGEIQKAGLVRDGEQGWQLNGRRGATSRREMGVAGQKRQV